MKKSLRFVVLLALCFILGLSPAMAAEKQNMNLFMNLNSEYSALDATEKWAVSAASLGDALYVLTDTTLEKWLPGMAGPVQVMEGIETFPSGEPEDPAAEPQAVLSALLSDGDRLLALDISSGRIWKLVDGEEFLAPSFHISLDWAGMVSQSGEGFALFNLYVMDMDISGGILWLLCFDYERDPFGPILFRWELETGKALEPIAGKGIQGIASYREGQLLCLFEDSAESPEPPEDGEFPPVYLGALNPQTGELAKLTSLRAAEPTGLCYDNQTDTAYYLDGGTLMRLKGLAGPEEASAYFPVFSGSGEGSGLLPGGMYYIVHFDGVFVRGLDMPGVENGALTIYGGRESTSMMTLAYENPEALLRSSSAFYDSEEELIDALQEGPSAPDVLLLDSYSLSIPRLIAEGHAMDLSENAQLTATVQAMAPVVSAFVSEESGVYGLPLRMDGYVLGYNPSAWAELGLSEGDLPKTYGELLDFMAGWATTYGKDYPDTLLFDRTGVKGDLLPMIMDAYFAHCQKDAAFASSAEPILAELLQKMEQLPPEPPPPEEDAALWDYSENAIFSTYYDFGQFYSFSTLLPLPLALQPDTAPLIPASLHVALVSPGTAHPDTAAQYIDILMRGYDRTGAYISLFPEHNDPVPYPFFEERIQEWKVELETAKTLLEKASPEQAEVLEEEIAFLEDSLANPEEYISRELVTKEQIEAFRQRVEPYLLIAEPNPLYQAEGGDEDFVNLMQQYLEGVSTARQFLDGLAQLAESAKQ